MIKKILILLISIAYLALVVYFSFVDATICVSLILVGVAIAVMVALWVNKFIRRMREGERRYTTLVEGASDGVMIVRKGDIKYANPALLKLTGYKNLAGKNIYSLFGKDSDFHEYYEKKKKGSQFSNFYEGKIENARGKCIDVEISIGTVEYEGFAEELIIVRDTTKKKKMEEIFSYQEEKFRTLAENTPDIIARFDKECRYIYVNSAAEKEMGIDKKDFFWKTERDLNFSEERARATCEAVQSVFKNKERTSFYSEVEFESGIKHYYTFLVPETAKDGKVRSVLSISRDITEVREIDKAKSEFISITSHQIKSPLSVIRWCSISLLEDETFDVKEEHREAMENIYDSTKKLVRLSDAFLNVTALDLEMFVFNPKETDIVGLAKSIVDEYRDQVNEKEIKLEENYSSIPQIIIDPYTIKIILRSLLSNAVNYTEEKGNISFSLIEEGENDIVFYVGDDGCGIKKEEQGKIFQKFFRTETAKEVKSYGSGLDLYIVKSIVDKKGGKIFVESPNSKYGKGAAFKIVLPVTKK